MKKQRIVVVALVHGKDGTFKRFQSAAKVAARIRELGGHVTPNRSDKVTHVVVGTGLTRGSVARCPASAQVVTEAWLMKYVAARDLVPLPFRKP